jgi:hypothetical protein
MKVIDTMRVGSLLTSRYSLCDRQFDSSFNPQLTFTAAAVGGIQNWTGSRRKALRFSHFEAECPSAALCASCAIHQRRFAVQRTKIELGAKTWVMGGRTVFPRGHPAAGLANESLGFAAVTSSKLQDGDGVVIVDHGSRRAESNVMLRKLQSSFIAYFLLGFSTLNVFKRRGS